MNSQELGHDFTTSDHCTRCGAEQYESEASYLPCTHDFESTATDIVVDYLKSN